MTAYFDTSALVPVYVPEEFSKSARREAMRAGAVPFSVLHQMELSNALRLLCGRGSITAREMKALFGQIADDREANRLSPTPIDFHRLFELSAELSEAYATRLLCRTLDILHVGSAMLLGASRFVSADDRQLKLARALGLKVTDIKKRTPSRSRR